VRDIGEDDIQAVLFLTDADVKDDVIRKSVGTFKSQVPLANLVDVNAA